MFYIFQINFSPVIWILNIWCFPVSYTLLQDIFTDNVSMVCPPILETIQNGLINRIVAYSFNNFSGNYEMDGFYKSINFPLANLEANSFNANNGIGFIYGSTRKNGNNTFLISVDRTSLSDVGDFDVIITMAFDLPYGGLTFQMSTMDGLIYNRFYSRNSNSSSNRWRIYNSRYAVFNGFKLLIYGSHYARIDDICIFQVCANTLRFDSTVNKCTDKCYYKNCHSPKYCEVINDAAVCSCPLNYKLDSDGTTCSLSTLCLSKKCEYICNEVSGSAVCSCPTGMIMSSYNMTCQTVSPSSPEPQNVSPSSSESQNNKTAVIIIAILVPVVVIVILVLVAVYLREKKRPKVPVQNPFFQSVENKNISNDVVVDDWEIFPENFVINKKIGEGAYGTVFVAKIKAKVLAKTMYALQSNATLPSVNEDSTSDVAVKFLKDEADQQEIKDFKEEINLMKKIGYHRNIMNMFGCSAVKNPLCLIVEYMENGDLLQFLRTRRSKLRFPKANGQQTGNFIYATKHYFTESTEIRETNMNSAQDLLSNETPQDDTEMITPDDLLSFAWQVASGMEFLSKIKLVHRDLAARNVLVGAKKNVKISDFGLSRKIHYEMQYVGSKVRRLPVKWMSIESLLDQVFTSYSDVWAYGIVLFEIVTLGGTPYPTLSNRELLSFLKANCRMDRPENCSSIVYDIMLNCWNKDPLLRPTFTELRNKIEQIISQGGRYLSFDFNEESPYYNVPSFNSVGSETDMVLF